MAFDLRKKILNWVKPWVEVPVAGLDISDRSVKYLKFRPETKEGEIEFFGEASIPEGIVVGGEIRREEDLVTTLKGLISREGKRLRSCFIAASLPEEKGFLRLIRLPKVDREKVSAAVRSEIEANIPLPMEELIYGQEIIESPADYFDHLDVVITAFPKNIVESYVRALKGAGMAPSVLELESQAVARAVVTDQTHTAEIIIDIGRTRSGIMIVSGKAIIFTKTIGLGGQTFTENIARSMEVSLEKADFLKKEAGLGKKEYEGKVFSALLPACSALAEEIKRAIAYYQDHSQHAHGMNPVIDAVFLVGGEANIPGLATYFSSILKIPVSLGDPFAYLQKKTPFIPLLPKRQALAFTTAIGLALRDRAVTSY